MAYQYDENQGFRPEGAPPPPPPRKSGSEKNNNDLGSWIFIIEIGRASCRERV